MTASENKTTVLRPRRRMTIPPSTKKSTSNSATFVSKILLSISRKGIISKHELYFDNDPLTLGEMYTDGFLGDLEFELPDGQTLIAELEAGRPGDFPGDKVGTFVFRIRRPDTHELLQDIHVKRFSFSTRP